VTSEERTAADTARTVGVFGLGLGAVALVSSWTGWGGVVVGAAALACVAAYLKLAGRSGSAPRPHALVGAVLGAMAIVVGLVVQWTTLSEPDEDFGIGLTLDECMQQADTAILQRSCKAQHYEEYMQRYPDAEE
jgi:hypothetical protein